MRYQAFDLVRRTLDPVSFTLGLAHNLVQGPISPLSGTPIGRLQAAALETTQRLIKRYPNPGFNYGSIRIDGKDVAIHARIMSKKPFCNLIRFERAGCESAPKVLFVAALAGHYASLSRGTVEAFLPDHDVYITDWIDAKQVLLADGRFGFEDYVAYLIEFLQMLGPNTHVVGLCQATVPALVAAAVMAQRGDGARPRTLSLLAGPIDIGANQNQITKYADWVNPNLMKIALVQKVPAGYPGKGRRVYPGRFQLMGFMTLNLLNHVGKHLQFFKDVASGNEGSADKHREFYNDYFATMDGTEEFFVETLQRVFVDRQLARGTMTFRGERVDCAAIRDIPLLTIEGADDDMVALGVTEAAHRICSSLPEALREHHVQEGVGHYGVFSGSGFRNGVAPRIKSLIERHGETR